MLVYPCAIDLSTRTLRRLRSAGRSPTPDRFSLAPPELRPTGSARTRPPTLRRHLQPPRRRLPGRDRDGLPLHTRGRRPPGHPCPDTGAGHAHHPQEGVRDPRLHTSADRPCCGRPPVLLGKKKHHGVNVQVLADPAGRLLWVSDALPGAVHDLTAAPAPRHPRRPRRRRHQVLGGQGIPGRRTRRPCPDPGQAPARLAPPPQPRSRKDPKPRRTRHRHPHVLASIPQTALQHHEDHYRRPRHRHSRTHQLIKMERAQWLPRSDRTLISTRIS